jgi:hypothetical protein
MVQTIKPVPTSDIHSIISKIFLGLGVLSVYIYIYTTELSQGKGLIINANRLYMGNNMKTTLVVNNYFITK